MNRTEIAKIWLTESAIWIELNDGSKGCEHFSDYRHLAAADTAQRHNFVLSHFGIHWPDLDEDLSYNGFFNKQNQNTK